jgi:hypothetical protein
VTTSNTATSPHNFGIIYSASWLHISGHQAAICWLSFPAKMTLTNQILLGCTRATCSSAAHHCDGL